MKKLLGISLLCVMLLIVLATGVNAATTETLADELYAKGVKYGLTSADKVRIERYLSENPVTNEEADKILAKADEAVAVMEAAKETNYAKLTTAKKDELKAIATEAAKIIDATLVFKVNSVEVYKNGKLIETVTETNGKLAYTGNNITNILVVSVLAIIALATTVVAKRTVNAK